MRLGLDLVRIIECRSMESVFPVPVAGQLDDGEVEPSTGKGVRLMHAFASPGLTCSYRSMSRFAKR